MTHAVLKTIAKTGQPCPIHEVAISFVAKRGNLMAALLGMKRAASGRRKTVRFVVCVDNDGYQASLERNKIYVALADVDAESSGDIRVIDESGEDYLFAPKRFVAVELPLAVRVSVRRAS